MGTYVVVYENEGAEIARYTVIAPSELDAELRASRSFFAEQTHYNEFDLPPGLTFRIEGAKV